MAKPILDRATRASVEPRGFARNLDRDVEHVSPVGTGVPRLPKANSRGLSYKGKGEETISNAGGGLKECEHSLPPPSSLPRAESGAFPKRKSRQASMRSGILPPFPRPTGSPYPPPPWLSPKYFFSPTSNRQRCTARIRGARRGGPRRCFSFFPRGASICAAHASVHPTTCQRCHKVF